MDAMFVFTVRAMLFSGCLPTGVSVPWIHGRGIRGFSRYVEFLDTVSWLDESSNDLKISHFAAKAAWVGPFRAGL